MSDQLPCRITTILGSKGGKGKTTTAHALTHGLAYIRPPSETSKVVLLHTDDRRDPVSKEKRNYVIFDMRGDGKGSAEQKAEKLAGNRNRFVDHHFVVDGAGNRPERDVIYAQHSDLVLMPTQPDPEFLRTEAADAEAYVARGAPAGRMWFLPVAWESLRSQTLKHDAWLERYFAGQAHKLLPPFPRLSSLNDYKGEDLAAFPLSKASKAKVDHYSLRLAWLVEGLLQGIEDPKAIDRHMARGDEILKVHAKTKPAEIGTMMRRELDGESAAANVAEIDDTARKDGETDRTGAEASA